MWKWTVVLTLTISVGCAHRGILSPYPRAKLTILAVDDDQQPLSGMQVHVWLSESAIRDGHTDANGIFVAEGPCTIKDIPITISKKGFYDSRTTYEYPNYLSVRNNQWQPWNPMVKVLVMRAVNPIPMFAKKLKIVIPVLDQFVGYDLMKADWVAPYGVGEIADINFQMKKRYVDMWDFDSSFDLALPNMGDGFQKTTLAPYQASKFRLLRSAPIDGYVVTNMHLSESSTNLLRSDKEQSFYFRIRTVTNGAGQITSALYGKVYGNFGFDARGGKTGAIIFTFYLNPTQNDRNLEFDPKRNLFKNMKSWELVDDP